nr:hypothetical protein Iba_chr10dCG12730 [Ipomoea batatas]
MAPSYILGRNIAPMNTTSAIKTEVGNCSAWNHSERFGTEIFYYAQALNSHPARLRFGEMSSRDHADQSSARDCEAAQTGRGARIFLDGGCRRTEDDRHRGWWKTMEVCSGETVT